MKILIGIENNNLDNKNVVKRALNIQWSSHFIHKLEEELCDIIETDEVDATALKKTTFFKLKDLIITEINKNPAIPDTDPCANYFEKVSILHDIMRLNQDELSVTHDEMMKFTSLYNKILASNPTYLTTMKFQGGHSALTSSVNQNNLFLTKKILKYGISTYGDDFINQKNANGETALSCALTNNQPYPYMILELIKSGATITPENKEKIIGFLKKEHLTLRQHFVEHLSKLNIPNNEDALNEIMRTFSPRSQSPTGVNDPAAFDLMQDNTPKATKTIDDSIPHKGREVSNNTIEEDAASKIQKHVTNRGARKNPKDAYKLKKKQRLSRSGPPVHIPERNTHKENVWQVNPMNMFYQKDRKQPENESPKNDKGTPNPPPSTKQSP